MKRVVTSHSHELDSRTATNAHSCNLWLFFINEGNYWAYSLCEPIRPYRVLLVHFYLLSGGLCGVAMLHGLDNLRGE